MINDPIIYNRDIEELSQRSFIPSELSVLMRYLNALETTIQSHGRNHFLHLKQEMVWKYPGAEMEFIQLDNGANLTQTGKFKKWREGTVSGFPDVTILLSWKGQQKIIFVEFKRIGVPSSVKVSDNQKDWNQKLQAMGFLAFITNNPIYFEKKSAERSENFLLQLVTPA